MAHIGQPKIDHEGLVKPAITTPNVERCIETNTYDNVIDTLKSQPDLGALLQVIVKLPLCSITNDGFCTSVPSPKTAALNSLLVQEILPNFWKSLEEKERKVLCKCFRTLSGIGAVIARLGELSSQSKSQKLPGHGVGRAGHINDTLEVLEGTLKGENLLLSVWNSTSSPDIPKNQRDSIWKEFTLLVASGKIISSSAQAEDSMKSFGKSEKSFWMAHGERYAKWLGENLVCLLAKRDGEESACIAASKLLSRAMSLGYTDQIVWVFLDKLLREDVEIGRITNILSKLKPHEWRQFLGSVLKSVSAKLIERSIGILDMQSTQQATIISGLAALIRSLTLNIGTFDYVSEWLLSQSASLGIYPVFVIRAMIVLLVESEEQLTTVLDKFIERFGDSLFIKHSPIIHQEALAMSTLVISGYVHRVQPMYMFTLARSSIHMNSISNRITMASTRARFFGIAVGMAISELVERQDMKMKFPLEGSDKSEYQNYQKLTRISDKVGKVSDLANIVVREAVKDRLKGDLKSDILLVKSNNQNPTSPGKQTGAGISSVTKPKIIEILDDSDEEDGLTPYQKPDLDPKDDHEDPTLVNRDKPLPPVYIRDLLVGLRDSESYDKHHVALSSAANLIRRKTNFGKEVQDHIEELTSVIIGLNDAFEFEDFQDLYQETMMAVVLANPIKVGQILAQSYFAGEYSINQRLTMLTALGLGARELAGLEERGGAETNTKFPSQTLPDKLLKFYGREKRSVDKLSRKLEQTMIEPLALEAADKLSGPNVLKVRTFSSRLEVERKRKKPIANELSKVVANGFFFPLTGGWWAHTQSFGSASQHNSPYLLPTYLHTLSIILHASGPNTVSLPQMTAEFWDLLLALRAQSTQESTILSAVLFSLLMLLEVNEGQERIVRDHGEQLLETQRWVKDVFDALGGGTSSNDPQNEDNRVKLLAASVLVRCGEFIEKHQRILMGNMIDGL